jgi:hypothetical protein
VVQGVGDAVQAAEDVAWGTARDTVQGAGDTVQAAGDAAWVLQETWHSRLWRCCRRHNRQTVTTIDFSSFTLPFSMQPLTLPTHVYSSIHAVLSLDLFLAYFAYQITPCSFPFSVYIILCHITPHASPLT